MATDSGYNSAQILEMERILAIELEWKLSPPTMESWIKTCLAKWDEYWSQDLFDSFSGSMIFHEIFSIIKDNFISNTAKFVCGIKDLYTLFNLDSYNRYIQFTQLVDTIMIDVESIQFKPQAIVLSAIFWVIVTEWGLMTSKELSRFRVKRNLIK